MPKRINKSVVFRMFHRIQKLRADVSGEINAMGYFLLVTVVAIGAIVGLATFRDQIVQEFGDIAVGMESLDQSYSFTIGTETSEYEDTNDLTDPQDAAPACISVGEPASNEGSGGGGGNNDEG